MNDTVTLYHFTSEEHLEGIVLDGVLKPRMTPEHAKLLLLYAQLVSERPSPPTILDTAMRRIPPVVWFTIDPTPGWCCSTSDTGRRAVRITVELRESEVQDFGAWGAKYLGLAHEPPTPPGEDPLEHPMRIVQGPVPAPWVAIDYMHRDGVCPVALRRGFQPASDLAQTTRQAEVKTP